MTAHDVSTKPSFQAWLAFHRASATARGGRPLTASEVVGESIRHRMSLDPRIPANGLEPGEIVNLITGEIETGCLTITALAKALGTRPGHIAALTYHTGLTHRVLRHHSVPMVLDPALRKTKYYHRVECTDRGVREGCVIPLTITRERQTISFVLVTRKGQDMLRGEFLRRRRIDDDALIARQIVTARARIESLIAEGKTQAEIARLTGYSKQTVSYHMKALGAGRPGRGRPSMKVKKEGAGVTIGQG